MLILQPGHVKAILELINDPKEKEAVENFLRELQNDTNDPSKQVSSSLKNKRLAKKALDVICRVIIELIKHKLYGDFLDSLD